MLKRACSCEQIKERKKEIIEAVNKMYDEMDYQDISMKTISENISIARSSLYCYYTNKEEIMLDILAKDYEAFIIELINAFLNLKNKETICNVLADIYLNNLRLLKIISIHLTDIEMHVSLEKLIEFKKPFVLYFKKLKDAIKMMYIDANEEKIDNIHNTLIMLTHSLYPIICPNKSQAKAMENVGMKLVNDKYDFCVSYFNFILNK